jgi:hypothetical protein
VAATTPTPSPHRPLPPPRTPTPITAVAVLSLDPWTSRFGDADFVVVVVGGVAA